MRSSNLAHVLESYEHAEFGQGVGIEVVDLLPLQVFPFALLFSLAALRA